MKAESRHNDQNQRDRAPEEERSLSLSIRMNATETKVFVRDDGKWKPVTSEHIKRLPIRPKNK